MPDDVTEALDAWGEALTELVMWQEQIDGTSSVPRGVPEGTEIPYRAYPLGDDPLTTAKLGAFRWSECVAKIEEVIAAVRSIDDQPTARRHLHDHQPLMTTLVDEVEQMLVVLDKDLRKLDALPRPLSGSLSWRNGIIEHWIGFGAGTKGLLVDAVAKSAALKGRIDEEDG